ncbi:hypothetical protein ET445_01900 [Agromyces protaetiae]|uniref:DUF4430 domain-containing protein n=1 Tax=Agromyces protaetiae TaxID=2509455 RepID=A0A4P6F927_9MICO|nr:hypothetical protein [Agromyces protaetiae]QAY72274.1 hypothetical protein ET445_01900 [Agromyces protaetiae]
MTLRIRTLAFAVPAAFALALSLSACASPATEPDSASTPSASDAPAASGVATTGACDGDEGVTVVVDTGDLDVSDDPSGEWCVSADDAIGAADALAATGVTTEGTEEYGDQIVCRVNGVPSEDTALEGDDGTVVHEECQSMPPAFAYWSLWTKPAGGEWGYAEEGLSTLQLEPGDGVQLLFVLNNEPAAPSA